jgi:hypothetical protein
MPMFRLLSAALVGAAPLAFVSAETLLIVGAIVAGAGAVITGVMAFRASRRGLSDEESDRRSPSPSPTSLGMADDPIVAALVATDGDRRSRPARRTDRTDP